MNGDYAVLLSFKDILKDSRACQLLSRFWQELSEHGYGNMAHIPTYQALDHYKSVLLWEDLYNIWFGSDLNLAFREGGNMKRYFDSDFEERFDLFASLLTSGDVDAIAFENVLGNDLQKALCESGVAARKNGRLLMGLRCIPVSFGFVVADPIRCSTLSDGIHIGLDSMMFINFLNKRRAMLESCNTVLDLGCGTGIQGLFAQSRNPNLSVMAVDCNRRALECALLNTKVNGLKRPDTVQSDWYSGVDCSARGAFQLILCNPPFEWRGEEEPEARSVSGFGGQFLGHEQTRKVLAGLVDNLAEDGRALVITQTLATGDKKLAILDVCRDEINALAREGGITVHVLYEHLLVTEDMMKRMSENGYAHFVMIVLEFRKGNKRGTAVRVVDDRHFLKVISDRQRVKHCTKYWKSWLRNQDAPAGRSKKFHGVAKFSQRGRRETKERGLS